MTRPLRGRQAASALSRRRRAIDADLTALARFPEENPNAVIELTASGSVTYMNPVAKRRFPDLRRKRLSHPILSGVDALVAGCERGRPSHVEREIDVGRYAYEQKICFTRASGEVRVRIYTHDVTRRKRAEEANQQLAKRVVFAQEEERHRVSRELHDEAGQALTALKLSLELIAADPPTDVTMLRQNLREAIDLIDGTRDSLRSLARGLRPPSLDTVGLHLTIEAICRDFARRTQIPVAYRGTTVTDLSDAATISLYRVLQEALTNAAKHARPTSVTVRLIQGVHTVRLLVSDDGCGFGQRAATRRIVTEGIGLRGMRERLELLGGHLTIQSAVGRGVHLTAHVPREGT